MTKTREQIETEAVERFKAEWAAADAEGDTGNRVRRGPRAAGMLVEGDLTDETIERAAKAIWATRYPESQPDIAESTWAEMTAPDDWMPEALDIMEEARAALTAARVAPVAPSEPCGERRRNRYNQLEGCCLGEGHAGAHAWQRVEALASAPSEERCPECLGLSGAHRFVHVRHPQGGGGQNRPCSRGQEATAPNPDREKLAIRYCPEHGDLLTSGSDGADVRSARCRESHSLATLAALAVPLVAPVTPSEEREALIATQEALREALESSPSNLMALQLEEVTKERDRYKEAHDTVLRHNSKLHDEIAALAVPPVVNEAKLVEIINEHEYMYSTYSCACDWTGPGSHTAHQAAETVERQREWLA